MLREQHQPNTVQAAAEGLPNSSRRTALAVTGSGLIAAFGGFAMSTIPAAAMSGLSGVFEAHKLAYAAFNASLDLEWKLEASYFEQNPKEILVPISIGGAQSLYVNHDTLDNAIADAKDDRGTPGAQR